MKNNSFARFARAFFHFWIFGRSSCSFHEVKRPVLLLCGQREHHVQKCSISLITKASLEYL